MGVGAMRTPTAEEENTVSIKSLIRTIPDYPKPGIMFRDITTLLQDAVGLKAAIDGILGAVDEFEIDKVAGIEARGFILGGSVARELGVGFMPIRKQGKLPYSTISEEYKLEYGTDRLEIHTDAVTQGESILVVDDLIATGGTIEASIRVLERCGAKIAACAVVIDLPDLGGSRKLEEAGHRVISLCEFEGD